MNRRLYRCPFSCDLLAGIADELLAVLPGAERGDLTGALVLLPSARACRELGHRLLERSGRQALLLPRILTDRQWSAELAAAAGADLAAVPDDRIRTVILARALRDLDWVRAGTAGAAGLADAFIQFFDEVRRHGLQARVLDEGDSEPLVRLARAADGEVVAAEVRRIRQVWTLYRQLVPHDAVDQLLAVKRSLAAGEAVGPARLPVVAVAAFARLEPLRAELLSAALDLGDDQLVFVPEATAALDRAFLATWGEAERETDALAVTRETIRQLVPDEDVAEDDEPDTGLADRLEAQGLVTAEPARELPRCLEAETPEDEARTVCDLVVRWLRQHGRPRRGITVATADPQLARRITACLRDAGLDADNTVGAPLGTLPAGLLLRFILQAALTDLRAGPLLEVLGHPYTSLATTGAPLGTWALRLERLFRRETGPQSGLAGLLRRAAEHDAAVESLFERHGAGMRQFVDDLASAFAPLLAFTGGRRASWSELLDAVDQTWRQLAPARPLGEDPVRPDLTALDRLWRCLGADAARLPEATLVDFAADVGRLLAAELVPDHRPRDIPLVVTGLVEARLARPDLMLLAGLNDGVFPAAVSTPVVLPGTVRRHLGLPTWRDARARDAELFLRLLGGAPEVVLTWSRQRDGQPALPSPLVDRLSLVTRRRPEPAPTAVLWRRHEPPYEEIAARQSAFTDEPRPATRMAATRPRRRISWSALDRWRDCPYRVLLESDLALQADEEVRDEFGKREYGSVVHAVLRDALAPGTATHAALADGRQEAAAAGLIAVAREHFLPGAETLPERRLWLDAFTSLVPRIVATELERFGTWRPQALEREFVLPLADLADWLTQRAEASGQAPCPEVPPAAADVVLSGTIDRIDEAAGEGGRFAIIDYKTGNPPTMKAVAGGEDLQIVLYCLALGAGAVTDIRPGPAEACYYRLSDTGCGPVVDRKGRLPVLTDAEGASDLLLAGGRQVLDLALQMLAEEPDYPLLPRAATPGVSGGLPCRWCDHRGVCRVEERHLEPEVEVRLGALVNRREVR